MIDGTPPVLWLFPEAASQTYKAGEFVYRASGYLTICGADPSQILGIAMEDAHNSTAGAYDMLVLVATGQTLFKINVYHSVSGNNKIEAADLGTAYGLVNASNKWLVDKTDTGNTRVRVQKFYDAIGETAGFVLVTVLPAYREVA
jgi:hypothetical protein